MCLFCCLPHLVVFLFGVVCLPFWFGCLPFSFGCLPLFRLFASLLGLPLPLFVVCLFLFFLWFASFSFLWFCLLPLFALFGACLPFFFLVVCLFGGCLPFGGLFALLYFFIIFFSIFLCFAFSVCFAFFCCFDLFLFALFLFVLFLFALFLLCFAFFLFAFFCILVWPLFLQCVSFFSLFFLVVCAFFCLFLFHISRVWLVGLGHAKLTVTPYTVVRILHTERVARLSRRTLTRSTCCCGTAEVAPALLFPAHMFVLTSFVCCIAWCHIRELVWNCLDTQSKLEVVAARKDSWLQGGLDSGTAEIQYLSYVLYLGEEVSPGISKVPPSPLRASRPVIASPPNDSGQCFRPNGTEEA